MLLSSSMEMYAINDNNTDDKSADLVIYKYG